MAAIRDLKMSVIARGFFYSCPDFIIIVSEKAVFLCIMRTNSPGDGVVTQVEDTQYLVQKL